MNSLLSFFEQLINSIFKDLSKIDYIRIIENVLISILIIIAAKIVQEISFWVIKHIFNPKRKIYLDEKRAITLKSITKSLAKYSINFLALYLIISLFTNRTGAVLTGAGIVGLAVGFGAQNLVRDVITGFFILLENQFAVGEFVKIGSTQGIVEELGLRVTKLRDWGGELHIIPNGQIKEVTNYNRGSMRALVEVGIGIEEDIDRAIDIMRAVGRDIAKEMQAVIVEGPEVLGVVALNQSEVVIRIIARTKPMEQWAVERELRRQIKKAFDKEGIAIPYPRSIMVSPGPKEKVTKNESFPEEEEPVNLE